MKSSITTLLMAFGLAAVGVFSGLILIMYSEADDAPGGVLLGIVLMISTIAVAVRATRGHSTESGNHPAVEERCDALEAELHETQAQLDDLQRQMVQVEEKLAFTQTLLESRSPARPALPPRD